MAASHLFILFLTAIFAVAAVECNSGILHDGFELDDFQAHFHGSEEDGEVVIHIVGRTTGYVGFGIAPDGVMHLADLFIGGCADRFGNDTYYGDYYGQGNTPVSDTKQDVKILKCNDNGTHTEMEFSRKYDTGDSDQDIVIARGDIKVIWALGVSDDISQEHGEDRAGVVTTQIRESGAWTMGASIMVVMLGALTARLM